MDSVLPKCLATMVNRRDLGGLGLILLAAHLIITNACENVLTSGRSCFNISISMQEGKSEQVPLNTSETIRDVCIWNNSTSSWDSACHFSGRVCKGYLTYFNENISITEKTFVLHNVSKNAERIYKLLDMSGNCVAINVSVSDPRATSSPPRSGSSTIRLEEQNPRATSSPPRSGSSTIRLEEQNPRATSSPPRSGSSTIRLEEQSGMTWPYYLISIPVLAILDIL